MKLTKEKFEKARDSYRGYCSLCDQLTGDHCEPDAEANECPSCGNCTMMGVENALILHHIQIIKSKPEEY